MAQIKNSTPFKVTIARKSDLQLVARVSRRAVGPSDYVLKILPTVITRRGLFLAWNDREVIGITNFQECSDGSGWLSMARTDPAWQRRGVAILLQQKIADYARKNGVKALRLMVGAWNKPSLKASERGGFRAVCETAVVRRRLGTKKPHWNPTPISTKLELGSLLESTHLIKVGGYIGYRRTFLKLTRDALRALHDEGELYRREDSVLLVSKPDKVFRYPQSSLVVLQGPLGQSLIRGKEIAQSLGARVLTWYAPYDFYEISVARKLGFNRPAWGKHCFVFEKKI